MNRVNELKKSIVTKLSAVHPRVYFHVAPDNATYPFLVFDLPNAIDDGTLEQFVFDLDGWDDGSSTSTLDTLMYNADNALHRKSIVSNGLTFTMYRNNRLTVGDPDKRLKRTKYIYTVRTYEGGT